VLRRPDPLTIALAASALAAEALAVTPLVAWLAVLSGADPIAVPGWLSLATTGLVGYGLARLVLTRTQDPAWSRFLASGGWLLWTLGWWALRERSLEAIPGFFAALVSLDAPAVGLAILSALAWWRALGLASDPHPFQGSYLRWAIMRDLLFVGGTTVLAAASGGAAAQAVWHRLEFGAPLLLVVRLLTAVLVQAEAVRLAYPAAISSTRWVTWSAVLALGIVCLSALASLVAGPTLWPHLVRPVTWLLTLIVAVLVTLAVLLAVLIWTALRLARLDAPGHRRPARTRSAARASGAARSPPSSGHSRAPRRADLARARAGGTHRPAPRARLARAHRARLPAHPIAADRHQRERAPRTRLARKHSRHSPRFPLVGIGTPSPPQSRPAPRCPQRVSRRARSVGGARLRSPSQRDPAGTRSSRHECLAPTRPAAPGSDRPLPRRSLRGA
jgi:hypothetical protein